MTKLKSFLRNNYFVSLITILGAFLAFFNINSKSIWFDEAFTLIVTKSLVQLQNVLVTEEANMWLYLFFIYLVEKLGNAQLIFRAVSAIFATASIPVLFVLAKQLFGPNVAKITSFLLAINFIFIYYAQDGRSYSMLLFLTILSSLFFYKSFFNSSKKNLFTYGLLTSLAFYTHIYGGLVMVSQIIALALSLKHIKFWRWFIAYFLIGLSFFPLILAPSFNGHQVNWLPAPQISSLVGVLVILSSDSKIIFGIFSLILISTLAVTFKNLLNNWKKKESFQEKFLISYLFTPIILSFLVSITFKPIYQSIYFIISLPPFLILISLGLSKIKQKLILFLLLAGILIFSSVRLLGWYTESPNYSWVLSNQNDDWRDAALTVKQNGLANEAIIFYPYHYREAFEVYFDKNNPNLPKIIELSPTPYLLGGGTALEDPNPQKISEIASNYPVIWYVYMETNIDNLGRNSQRIRLEKQLSQYYKIVQNYDEKEIHIAKMELQ